MEKYFDVKAAFGDGTNTTDTVTYTADTTPRHVAIPSAFANNFVRIRVLGANLQYFFSSSASAVIAAAAPSAGGTQAVTQGESVPNGNALTVAVPAIVNNQPIFFCWVCDAAGTGVWITKASGVPGMSVGDR
jgi:hypothetical protein